MGRCIPGKEVVVNYYRELRRCEAGFFEDLVDPDWQEVRSKLEGSGVQIPEVMDFGGGGYGEGIGGWGGGTGEEVEVQAERPGRYRADQERER